MRRLLCFEKHDRAASVPGQELARTRSPRPKRMCLVVCILTKSLRRPLKSPYFGQSRVTLRDHNCTVASWPGPVRDPDSSAPQPPGARPAGSVEFRVRFNPQNAFRAGPPALFFSARPLRDAREHGVCLWNSNRRQRGVRNNSDYCKFSAAAPSIRPGLPSGTDCTSTAMRSMSFSPLRTSDSGTEKVCALPLHSPSFTQRRTTS